MIAICGGSTVARDVERLLSPKEAAALLGVSTSTLFRWADNGQLTDFRTLGGHRRYLEREVLAMVLRQARTRQRSSLL